MKEHKPTTIIEAWGEGPQEARLKKQGQQDVPITPRSKTYVVSKSDINQDETRQDDYLGSGDPKNLIIALHNYIPPEELIENHYNTLVPVQPMEIFVYDRLKDRKDLVYQGFGALGFYEEDAGPKYINMQKALEGVTEKINQFPNKAQKEHLKINVECHGSISGDAQIFLNTIAASTNGNSLSRMDVYKKYNGEPSVFDLVNQTAILAMDRFPNIKTVEIEIVGSGLGVIQGKNRKKFKAAYDKSGQAHIDLKKIDEHYTKNFAVRFARQLETGLSRNAELDKLKSFTIKAKNGVGTGIAEDMFCHKGGVYNWSGLWTKRMNLEQKMNLPFRGCRDNGVDAKTIRWPRRLKEKKCPYVYVHVKKDQEAWEKMERDAQKNKKTGCLSLF